MGQPPGFIGSVYDLRLVAGAVVAVVTTGAAIAIAARPTVTFTTGSTGTVATFAAGGTLTLNVAFGLRLKGTH